MKSIPKYNLNERATWFYNSYIYYPLAIGFYCFVKWQTVHDKADVEIIQNWGNSIIGKSAAFRTDPVWFLFESVCIPLIILGIYLCIDRLTRTLNFKSDELNQEHIFIFVKKPLYPISYFMAIFKRAPITSVFIYTNGLIYRFKKTNKKVKKIIYSDRIGKKKYIIINTGIKIKDRTVQLTNLHNETWSYINNCFPIFTHTIGINIFKLIKRRMCSGCKS
ncbi:hypothetical protein KAR91_63895 [Candidatus Pacearchaeota archaeon]|nr:hypothetical protein [Candidatus Pacearchaeota archaeon]